MKRSAVLALLLASCAGEAPSRPPAPPNIVVILTDDQGYADVGCFGAKDLRTPNLDRMAREGMRFTDFYVAQAVCTASRAALLTGCYPNRVGLHGALNHQSPIGISDGERLLPELCRSRGYATAAYGKWHLGCQPKFLPTRHGFDEFFGIPYSNDNGPLHPTMRGLPALPLFEGEAVIDHDPDQRQFTRRITDHAVKFIERNRARPFFLYVPHIMPHVPIHASDAFRGRSARGLYGDVIEELDASVGEILAALQSNGVDDNTLVMFFSDNGPFLSYGTHAGRAEPLREGKLTAWDGGMRSPCILRWPGRTPAGRVCPEPVMSIDLLPTLAGLIGAPLPTNRIDGLDILPILEGRPGARSPHDALYFYAGEELQALRSGDWKLHVAHEYLTPAGPPRSDGKPADFENMKPEGMDVSGIRGIASRHGYRVEKAPAALYDVRTDPGETTDVAAAHPDVVRRLEALLEKARADLGDALTGRKGPGVRPPGHL
ncbi:MAG: sulfatase [Planctomycetaceae bacterium]|nr:sulfatase [Planctomycetaceae bacterium]